MGCSSSKSCSSQHWNECQGECLLSPHLPALTEQLLPCRALDVLEQERSPAMREALRAQMMEFGRTPKQLFAQPHLQRRGFRRRGILCCVKPHRMRLDQPPSNLLGAVK